MLKHLRFVLFPRLSHKYTHTQLVFAENHHLRLTVLESDEGLLPITYMVAPTDAQDSVATVETVEEESRAVKCPVALVHGDQYSRYLAVSAA